MKSIHDYLKDPRILDDPDMAEALDPIKEIHAARLMLQDEIIGMDSSEKITFINTQGKKTLESLGIVPKIVHLAGKIS